MVIWRDGSSSPRRKKKETVEGNQIATDKNNLWGSTASLHYNYDSFKIVIEEQHSRSFFPGSTGRDRIINERNECVSNVHINIFSRKHYSTIEYKYNSLTYFPSEILFRFQIGIAVQLLLYSKVSRKEMRFAFEMEKSLKSENGWKMFWTIESIKQFLYVGNLFVPEYVSQTKKGKS